MNNEAKKATDPADLERKILNPNIGKNEAEWWARERILALQKEVDKAERERTLCYACGKTLEEANERKEREAITAVDIDNSPRIACVRTRESRQQSHLNGAPTGSLPSPLYPGTIQGPTFFSDNPDHYNQHADAGKEQS
jgi:hypothetical protein